MGFLSQPFLLQRGKRRDKLLGRLCRVSTGKVVEKLSLGGFKSEVDVFMFLAKGYDMLSTPNGCGTEPQPLSIANY